MRYRKYCCERGLQIFAESRILQIFNIYCNSEILVAFVMEQISCELFNVTMKRKQPLEC